MNTSSGWSRQPPASLSELEIHWLFAPGSLTERLSALGEYSLEPVDQRHAAACAADASLLGVEPDSPIWVREVVMRLDAQPCVTARSIASARALETQWKPLTGYGSLPLGHILYDDPAIVRAPFECALLMPDDPLDAISRRYARAAAPPRARRSAFVRNGATLVVSECFLPQFWSGFAQARLAGA
ncbi:chorismate--pyruvate lyase family protein [Burkholderia pseudomallei]|uniref:chorismate--pyruvate lyase family protein n=1 Tax=Burkholderia pseudomallei TaxID=28450 RepID=UPI000536FA1B|nr:chorismate lyase [Burkholderia pseudomallei]KGX51975.1 chorismate lyase family protein [Burkholderia pseudomallei TSV32]